MEKMGSTAKCRYEFKKKHKKEVVCPPSLR